MYCSKLSQGESQCEQPPAYSEKPSVLPLFCDHRNHACSRPTPAQDTIGSGCFKGTSLAQVWPGVHWHSQLLYWRAALQWGAPVCAGEQGCWSPRAGLCSFCWTAWGSTQPTSPAIQYHEIWNYYTAVQSLSCTRLSWLKSKLEKNVPSMRENCHKHEF